MFDIRVKINAVPFLKNKFPVAMSKFHLPLKYKEYFFALVFEMRHLLDHCDGWLR